MLNSVEIFGGLCGYLRWESNPNLKFRKLSFYPLNYRANKEKVHLLGELSSNINGYTIRLLCFLLRTS